MSDYENAMSAGPAQALRRHVNAFRAGREESHGPSSPALRRSQALGDPPSQGSGGSAQTFTSPPLQAVREHVAGMSDEAKAIAARNAEILTVAAQGMAARPYAERKAIMAHMTPHLQQALGVGDVASFDPTDANLTQVVGEATMVRGMLGGAPTSPPAATLGEAPPDPPISVEPGGQ